MAEAGGTCGAQTWAYDDDGCLILYGTCTLPAGHPTGWHQETREGKVWAEWRGPIERVPAPEDSQ